MKFLQEAIKKTLNNTSLIIALAVFASVSSLFLGITPANGAGASLVYNGTTRSGLQSQIDNASSGDIILIKNSITFDGTPITLSKDITIQSENTSIPITLTQNTTNIRHFNVNPNGTLTLKNITLDGNDKGGGVQLLTNAGWSSGGKFIMEEGTTIRSCANNGDTGANYGGGVHLESSAVFTMNGGVIENCSANANGAGVTIVGRSQKFYMYGGIIRNNKVTSEIYGGGGISVASGTFKMYGGEIYGNQAKAGGGVGVLNSYDPEPTVFIMHGGSIYENTAGWSGGGVYVGDGASFTLDGGRIHNNSTTDNGGGITGKNAIIKMVKGEISGNHALNGGGVYNDAGTFTMENGIISSNTAQVGGGMNNSGTGTFIMSGGEVFKNVATDKGGGVFNDSATFTMKSGKIFNNHSHTDGGGVYNGPSDGILNMNNGEISDNTANNSGGGIYTTYPALSRISVGSDVVFSNNIASAAFERNPDDDPLYAAQIKATAWTAPLIQGYNNYDISYEKDTPISWTNVVTMKYVDRQGNNIDTPSNPEFTKKYGDIFDVVAPAISQYVFVDWKIDRGALQGNTNPTGIIMKGVPMTFTLVYGHDRGTTGEVAGTETLETNNPDGIEDILITKKFETADGTSLRTDAQVIVNVGETFNDNPSTITGYTYVGYNADGGALVSSTVGPTISPVAGTLNATVIYIYEVTPATPLYTLTYNGNGSTDGSAPAGGSYDEDHTLMVKDQGDLANTNHTFQGWATRSDGAVEYTAGSVLTIKANTTLYAIWNEKTQYSVIYDGNGNNSGSEPPVNSYYDGEYVTLPNQGYLLKNNHTFLGWATRSTATAPDYQAESTFMISANTTLYAVWQDNNANVTYVIVTYQPGTHGTFSAHSTNNLVLGDTTPSAPHVTSQKGWTFTGWSPERSLTVTGNIIYVAQWTQTLYTIQFVDWDGTLLNSQQVAYSGNATGPANPKRSGYTFSGWDHPYTNVQANTTVTALYTVIPSPPKQPTPTDPVQNLYTVQFVNWDGTVIKTQLVASGFDATAPPNPTQAGYTFENWDCTYTNVQSDIKVTALYKEIVTISPTPDPTLSNTTKTTKSNQQTKPSQVLRQETFHKIKESGLPTVIIGNNEIALVGLSGMMVWPLVNLILCVFGILLALFTARRVLQRKNGQNTPNTMNHYRDRNAQYKQKQRNHVYLIIIASMGILGIIVFMITENMSNLMVLVDQWTLVHAVIFAVEIAAAVLASRHMRKTERMAEREERFSESFGQ